MVPKGAEGHLGVIEELHGKACTQRVFQETAISLVATLPGELSLAMGVF